MDDERAYTSMLEEHAAHVFDYCSRLAGDDADAASAAETAMMAAQSLLADPDRLRAWLFALARQEIVAKAQPPGQDQDAEIRDLVQRHGIRPEDLSAVLGVSPERAQEMLADAEADAMWADAEAEGPVEVEAPAVHLTGVDELAEVDAPAESALELPDEFGPPADDAIAESGESTLEPLPSWIWERTVAGYFDDGDLDASSAVSADLRPDRALGQASAPFGRARRRLGYSAILVAVAGSAAAAVVYLGGFAGQADTHGGAQKPDTGSAGPAVSSAVATRHVRTGPLTHHHRRPRRVSAVLPEPGGGVFPVTSTSTQPPVTGVLTPPGPRHSGTPSPSGHISSSSPPPTIGPSPTPTSPSPSPSTTPSP